MVIQDHLVGYPMVVHHVVEVRAAEHGDDAGQVARRRGVDGHEAPARNIAARERNVQRAGHGDVVDILAVAGQETSVFRTRHPLTDEPHPHHQRASSIASCHARSTMAAPTRRRYPAGPCTSEGTSSRSDIAR